MKRFLLSLLAIVPIFIIAQTVRINGINYELTPKKVGTATVAKDGYITTYKDMDTIIIPSTIIYEDTEYKVTSVGASAFLACTAKYIELPNTIERIATGAFRDCRMKRINIPENVIYIGRNAFDGCNNLQRVDITDLNSWLKITFDIDGSWYPERERPNPLFYAHHLYLNNEEITSLSIPSGITQVNTYAFAGLSNLEAVEFSNSITSIGVFAFHDCISLKEIVIPDNVISIGERAFEGCTLLETITLSKGVKDLSKGLFTDCITLTEVRIPEGTKTVGYDCFKGCKNIKRAYIEDGVEELKDGAFENCENLEDFYCYCANPPKAYTLDYKGKVLDYVFSGSYTNYATLHVPASALETYRSKAPWNLFGNIVPLTDEETGIYNCHNTDSTPQRYYTIEGRPVDSPKRGIYIMRASDGTSKKVLIK